MGHFLKGLALPLVCIACFKLFLAPANDLFTAGQSVMSLLTDFSRYIFIFTESYQILRALRDGSISVVFILLAYLVLAGRTRTPQRVIWPVLLILLAQLASYYLVFLTTPYSQDWHISASVGRLYLHVFPSLVLAAFLWLKSPHELKLNQSDQEYAPDH
jgi:hypothetical protein